MDKTAELRELFGDQQLIEEQCPGIYYICADLSQEGFPQEYYIVDAATPNVSAKAKMYGKSIKNNPNLLSYSLEDPYSGYMAVKFELFQYYIKNKIPLPEMESIQNVAVFGMEVMPEYFGEFPAPRLTPRGMMLRYKRLMNGVFSVQTDCLDCLLAVCYPIWKCVLTNDCIAMGEQSDYDKQRGIDTTHGYLFFSEDTSSLVFRELADAYEEIGRAALYDWTS